jgi:hypothetical protein
MTDCATRCKAMAVGFGSGWRLEDELDVKNTKIFTLYIRHAVRKMQECFHASTKLLLLNF